MVRAGDCRGQRFYTGSCHQFFLGVSPDGDLFPCGMF
jgi:hypothetical protein